MINSVISDVMYCQSNSLEDCVKVEIEIMVSIYLDNGINNYGHHPTQSSAHFSEVLIHFVMADFREGGGMQTIK